MRMLSRESLQMILEAVTQAEIETVICVPYGCDAVACSKQGNSEEGSSLFRPVHFTAGSVDNEQLHGCISHLPVLRINLSHMAAVNHL